MPPLTCTRGCVITLFVQIIILSNEFLQTINVFVYINQAQVKDCHFCMNKGIVRGNQLV